MVVKNKTILTKEEVITEVTSTAKRDYTSRYILSLVCVVFGVLLLILGLSNTDSSTNTFAYIFLAIGIAYIVLTLIQSARLPKKIRKEHENDEGITFEFLFKEQSANITILENGKRKKIEYPYIEFKRIIEREDSYQFRVDQCIIVAKKSGFENKRMEDFFVSNVKKNKKAKIKLLKKSE